MADLDLEKLLARLRALKALAGSAPLTPEERSARAKLDELLAKHALSEADLAEPEETEPPSSLDMVEAILREHLHLSDHQFVAVTLWIAHTFVYGRFAITPRLTLVSPVPDCGKTTLLDIVLRLASKPKKFGGMTAAVMFRTIDKDYPTLLLDEADNMNLFGDANLKAVFNNGHRCDMPVPRFIDGAVKEFSVFSPLATGSIGILPLPVMSRALVIHMERAPASVVKTLVRFDPKNADQLRTCDMAARDLRSWTRQVAPDLDLDPPMPEGLRNRPADNSRVLLSLADACSPDWGKRARSAAIALSRGQDEALGVLLLADIREIFDRHATDRLPSTVIIADLNELPDGLWGDWSGPRGDQTPRKLRQGDMARLLAPFGIRPKSIWPLRRGSNARSAKGYTRDQFERAWASYCDGGTPSQPSNVGYLRGVA